MHCYKFIHIHGTYMLFVIKNVIFKLITCKKARKMSNLVLFEHYKDFGQWFYMRHYMCNG